MIGLAQLRPSLFSLLIYDIPQYCYDPAVGGFNISGGRGANIMGGSAAANGGNTMGGGLGTKPYFLEN